MFPTAFPFCCRWYQRVRQRETDFTLSKLHLSFVHLFSAYLSLLFIYPSRRRIKEQYGKTKEIARMFSFKETFLRVSALTCLPSDFNFAVCFFVFKHISLWHKHSLCSFQCQEGKSGAWIDCVKVQLQGEADGRENVGRDFLSVQPPVHLLFISICLCLDSKTASCMSLSAAKCQKFDWVWHPCYPSLLQEEIVFSYTESGLCSVVFIAYILHIVVHGCVEDFCDRFIM